MGRKKTDEVVEQPIVENISIEPLESVMNDRYATYAKYVIQDRAIPDVRDGLKPVQRRIIFTMYKSGNTFNKPTKKCAHTVGAVMGTFHPHGDTSIYDALARMSQDWKLRYPLIDFQGNNGSIDGDMPAAYRYTESRLSELSNELVRGIEKKTVDMQLNFDDTELEPVVLPSRFPNLLVNGTEGIAVALATEIPPHNLREVIEAVIYRINHKTATAEDLFEIVHGPDFPGGGIIYNSESLKNIYLKGRGKIEIGSKAEIIDTKKGKQIVITEIPYKVVKKQLVYEIDLIIHSKQVSGLEEVRDESEGDGIRIVIDCKEDAKVDLLLKYLKSKTSLVSSYSANMVAIVRGHPKTLSLLDFVDAYIDHQVDVITRSSRFDLEKYNARLHIVEGLIIASLNINEVVDIIRKSNDKADSKVNIMKRFSFSNEQAEAIVTMPLYKLSHTDEQILEKEKEQLIHDIEFLKGILDDPAKLNRVIIKDLKNIANIYGDDRRTIIVEKEDIAPIDKRELIAKEETILVATRDGYIKRSSIKSYKGSGDNVLPGLKDGDAIIGMGQVFTTDYAFFFTNKGNYACVPVHKITDNRWKDEGIHLNSFVNLSAGEKVIKCMAISKSRDDLYIGVLTKFGQIKRFPISLLETSKRSKPIKYMNLLNGDSVVGVSLLTGNSNLLILTNCGDISYYNENDLSILSTKAGGVKSIMGLNKKTCAALIAFDQDEKAKFVLFTDKGHMRVCDNTKLSLTNRLGKVSNIMPMFKNDVHNIVSAYKADNMMDNTIYAAYLNDNSVFTFEPDLHLTDSSRYAKKNIDIPNKTIVLYSYNTNIDVINSSTISHPVTVKTKPSDVENTSLNEDKNAVADETNNSEDEDLENKDNFKQMSIFDDIE